jgi:hypothetical protein
MNNTLGTEQMIEKLIHTTYGEQSSLREKHVFRETLYALVRLAKAEQMLELRQDIRKAVSLQPGTTLQEPGKIE